MFNLLYICQYNIIRSPAAEQITNAKIKKKGLENLIHITSRSLDNSPFGGISTDMASALMSLGYAPKAHWPKQIDKDLLKEQNLILCMERFHIKRILKIAPECKNKVFTLPEYANPMFPHKEITDPYTLIEKIPIYQVINYIPDKLRNLAYKKLISFDPRTNEKISNIYMTIAKEIEEYAEIALDKIQNSIQI